MGNTMRARRIHAGAWSVLAAACLILAACSAGASPTTASAAGNGATRSPSAVSPGNGSTPAPGSSPGASGSPAVTSPAPASDLSWPQLDGGPARTGYQPGETQIGTGNVASLSQARIYPAKAYLSAPLIANGILYVDADGLYAFDATGATHCSAAPASCTPLWTAATAYFHGMAVADGKVFVTDDEGIQAFDAAGSENCSGTPKVCQPLWQTSTHLATGPGFTPGSGSPTVAGGVLYVPGYGDGGPLNQGGALVAAFDAAGKRGCSGTPVICVPMWTTTGVPGSSGNEGSPAVAGGVLYIANGSLYAFDAAGSANCPVTATGKTCAPLWIGAMPAGAGSTSSAPAVAGGMVYVGTGYSGLFAFNAAGSANCSVTGSVKTCAPLWHAPSAVTIGGTPAVANGVVYTVSSTGILSAFNAAAPGNCPGTGTVTTCTLSPLWTSEPGAGGYVTSSSPIVANGVVYFSSTDGGTYAYDAAGSQDCSTTAAGKTCAPLWHAITGKIGGGSPAVVNGVLFINIIGNGTVYAYTLTGNAITRLQARGELGHDVRADRTAGIGQEADCTARLPGARPMRGVPDARCPP
jgi:PQQ-like domain